MCPVGIFCFQRIRIYIHRLESAFISAIPSYIRIVALEYHLAPAIIYPPCHVCDAEPYHLYYRILTKPPRRKSIGHIQQRMNNRLHRMTDRVGATRYIGHYQADIEGIRTYILMDDGI